MGILTSTDLIPRVSSSSLPLRDMETPVCLVLMRSWSESVSRMLLTLPSPISMCLAILDRPTSFPSDRKSSMNRTSESLNLQAGPPFGSERISTMVMGPTVRDLEVVGDGYVLGVVMQMDGE